jgi:hypothetical protein
MIDGELIAAAGISFDADGRLIGVTSACQAQGV